MQLTLTPRQICDLELIENGAFAPLTSFMGKADYESVCSSMRLKSGAVFPIPIVLDLTEDLAGKLTKGSELTLLDHEGISLAALTVEELWQPDRKTEAQAVYGTDNPEHPGVQTLLKRTNPVYVAGKLRHIQAPHHYDFVDLRKTPTQLREEFAKRGWKRVVGFQTRNPTHRAHFELMLASAKKVDAKILFHPVVGLTKPGDIDHFTRVRGYKGVLKHFPKDSAALSLLNLAMRMAGPREAVWHSIVRKNHGCTHFIVGRDHAGPGSDSKGKPFYDPYAAQALMQEYAPEIGIEPVFSREMVYIKKLDTYVPENEVPEGQSPERISASQLRKMLDDGSQIPEWFTFPEVATELLRSTRPKSQQGFTVFFTGLPSSGKSTIANALVIKLSERGGRRVTLLDGDLVRKHLSSELGFSKEHRDLNIRRIGYVASEITKHGGIAVCAPIAPYDQTRKDVREMISAGGGFVLVHVATPLAECEKRDRKGLYQKARKGELGQFTGISDPYEEPTDAEIAFDTLKLSAVETAEQIVAYLEKAGYLGDEN